MFTKCLDKVELELLYGAEAEKVMSHKRSLGLIRKDQNVPDGELFLIEQSRVDVSNETNSLCQLQTCINAIPV